MLVSEKKFDFEFYYSKQPLNGIKPYQPPANYKYRHKLHNIKNYFFKGILIWQSSVLSIVIKKEFDIAFFMGDMSVISTWIGALICRLRKKRVVYWGHGIYGNESFYKLFFRLLFLKLAHVNLVYENRAKKLLLGMGFKKEKLIVIYNSLNYDLQYKYFNKLLKGNKYRSPFKESNIPTILFIGRLTRLKKIDQLIKCIERINKLQPNVNMLIIGDGPEKEKLKNLCSLILDKKRYIFLGAIYDEEKLAKFLFNSSLCVSPGNIGLTAIHSLSYGTPVVSHDNLINQMPEVEAIVDGENGFLFKENNIENLAEKISCWIQDKKSNKKKIRRIIEEKYNPHYQKKIIDNLIING